MDYFGARYYSSEQGRFTSPDFVLVDQSPVNPQSWNLYNYTLNSPFVFIDPTGLAHVDSNGFLVGDKDGEIHEVLGVWQESTQSWGKPTDDATNARTDEPVLLDDGQVRFLKYYLEFANSEGFVPKPEDSLYQLIHGKTWVDPTTLYDSDFILEMGVGGAVRPAIKWLRQVGLAAERIIAKELIAKGYSILGRQVSANTAAGRRVIDLLVRDSGGQIFVVEVKSGTTSRTTVQFLKDGLMASQGAVLVGENVPIALRGQRLVIDTIEVLVGR